MSVKVLVPILPESVSDATLIAWHKKIGDTITRDENLLDLETDKVVLEVPAPCNGVLSHIFIDDGVTVTSGECLAEIIEQSTTESQNSIETKSDSSDSVALSPSTRRLIEEHRLNPNDIKGTGKHDRITKEDVLMAIEKKSAPSINPPAKQTSPITTPVSTQVKQNRAEQRVPMTRLRARIAERLVEAQQSAAMLTTFNEVNMQPVMALRKRYQTIFQEKHEIKLGFMSFFVKACTEGLKKFPIVNASIDGPDIVYHGFFDIGIAVSSSRGLVVPVLRNTHEMSFVDIEKKIMAYATAAQDGTLSYEDLTGGTFTITNGGAFGSMLSTPILNPPQSAILGMHNIVERPVVEQGEIVIRPIMYIALSYDHRIIDGRDAVQFLLAIKQAIEDPARILLQI